MSVKRDEQQIKQDYKIQIHNIDKNFEPWIEKARERIFSLAAGNRIGSIAPRIMEIGFAKVLYAANELGVDFEQSNPFVLFAPDGTCSYNPIRTKRGFSYGAYLNFDFDGIMATNNSMPNGCGFSMYEILTDMEDDILLNYLSDTQVRLGQDKLSQLGKGNHFAGLYHVLDPLSGENTNRRFVVVHCSGHVGGHKLYHPNSWLEGVNGFHEVSTPHGTIQLMESEAKRMYLQQYGETDTANSVNRDQTVAEIFPDIEWKKLEEITHQGLDNDGNIQKIGIQIHDGMMPIAFNPEEGLVAVRNKPNLSRDFVESWSEFNRIERLGLEDKMENINFTPHGAGYEFRFPIDTMDIYLNKEGIERFSAVLSNNRAKMDFEYFREIREWMTYRRKFPIMNEVVRADLAEVMYEMPSLMQIYPLVSIPGGSH